ncbi:hypothetical protein C8R44DRAFT_733406 [Mycena epipterygia]|nr:hypothetical protein C8R44DRAFT_733406 [Mycena epipterygia]
MSEAWSGENSSGSLLSDIGNSLLKHNNKAARSRLNPYNNAMGLHEADRQLGAEANLLLSQIVAKFGTPNLWLSMVILVELDSSVYSGFNVYVSYNTTQVGLRGRYLNLQANLIMNSMILVPRRDTDSSAPYGLSRDYGKPLDANFSSETSTSREYCQY